eukprot:TRINITY_DN56316_c0_g1_i1.p2 TRINITY_DN56316_c0_g1~~TRINITY_DN56316_c0_g1_i1.p2  ORF type:complete len:218 (-),score=56.84 TRINITY_DN56316_c0_g1_i1:133-786(-)
MYGENKKDGAGLCAYLLDPSVEGWQSKFDGTGHMGFVGKTGAIIGIALDNTGDFTGGADKEDHLTIKRVNGVQLKTQKIEGGFMTEDEEWKQVHIKFDLADMKCDVKLDGKTIMDNIEFGDIKIPSKLCLAVCGAATDKDFRIAVNDVKLENMDEEEIHNPIEPDPTPNPDPNPSKPASSKPVVPGMNFSFAHSPANNGGHATPRVWNGTPLSLIHI